jgi:ABC-2 type transport system permease protein
MNSKVAIIASYTFKEIIKSRILYVTLALGVALMIVTYVATEFTYGVPEKIALDFGLGTLSLSSLGIAGFMGATLLPNELNSRTVYMVISRPVSRWVFISGKILGLISVLAANVLFLTSVTLLCSYLLGGSLNQAIVYAALFNLLECILLLLTVVFCSLYMNTILASLTSMLFLVLSHALKETQDTSFVASREIFKKVLVFFHLVLPGFYKLNMKDFVVYNQDIPMDYLISSLMYGICYCFFLYMMIILIFNKKNLD